MFGLIHVLSLFCIVSKSVLSIIWPPSFFVHKCCVGKRIMLRFFDLANRFITIQLIICRVAFCSTITTCSSAFQRKIVFATLLFSKTILLLFRRPFLALVSIAQNSLSLCCCICSVKVMTDVN